MNLEKVPCYCCGSEQHEPYATENGFQLVRCASCGLLYLAERPANNEITAATRTGQHRGDETIDTTGLFNDDAIPRYLSILSDFFSEPVNSSRTWLDVGCGHGEFVAAVSRFFEGNVEIKGCEPNAGKIASAKSHGLNVDFFDLSTHDQQYDVLSLLNVFSHLPDPLETLEQWNSLIVPGGHLLLETGHSSHLSPADHHKPYYLPDHLCFANRNIMEQILGRLGFRILNVKIYRHTVFPPVTLRAIARESIKRILGQPSRLSDLFPREPNRDMFILAQRT